MKKHRKPYLQFNPHIRGLKSLESCEKLTQRGKIFYKSLRPESDPAEFLYKLKEPIKKDVKNYFSPARLETHQTSSVGRFKIISKSPSKETFPVKRREFSLQEQEEIDKLIDNKLNIELTSIKASIPQKIKKLSKNLIFSEELNTLRADSQAAVISKKV